MSLADIWDQADNEEARWHRYDAEIRRIVTCPLRDCTTEDHVRALRAHMLAAYDEGWLAARLRKRAR